MHSISVVLAHHDPAAADSLLRPVQHQFLNFAIVKTADELQNALAGAQASLGILDLELVGFSQVGELCHKFPGTAFVCIHRLADDAMWSQALAAGAMDCCFAGDLPHILQFAERYVAVKEAQPAPAA